MRKKGLQGAGTVFRFSFRQQTGKTGWRLTTILPALLFLIAIPLIMVIALQSSDKEITETPVRAVYVADVTGLPSDYALLNETGDSVFSGIEYIPAADMEAAIAAAAQREGALALLTELGEGGYELTVIRPEGTSLTASDARDYTGFLLDAFPVLAREKSGLTGAQLAELSRVVLSAGSTSTIYRDGSLKDGYETVREILEMILPYLGIMLLYFMVLVYGQGIAGSVILEKSSKLMDTMLLSLQPQAMILGKTLAGWLAGVVQMAVWVAGAVLGCVLGRFLVLQLEPGSTMGILQFFSMLGSASGLFTLPNIIAAILLILAGFLMYCAIASIGGAMASKPEDLGSCNSIFTLLLLASFFLTMFGENSSSRSLVSNAAWMNYVPFTAVMSTPARALLGQVPLLTVLISLVLTLAVALLAVLAAGKLYRLLVFRRGDPPKVADIPKLLRLRQE
jgi:ABC-type Na+ efflux pump permease subunit